MKYDVIIIGGSFAGLAGAVQLGRARRKVLVIDGGKPRNRFSDHSHGILGHEGKSAAEILNTAREQISMYKTVEFKSGLASKVEGQDGNFTVYLGAEKFVARKLIFATGVQDRLPEIPGIAERWGKTVLHCPYCHGYEIGMGSIGVIARSEMSIHQAAMAADWGDVTLFTQGKFQIPEDQKQFLKNRKVIVEEGEIESLVGNAPALEAVLLKDGRRIAVKAVFIGPDLQLANPLLEQLGVVLEETPMGSKMVKTDEWKGTGVPGVAAAGDMSRMAQNATFAMAEGAMAAIGTHRLLILEDGA